VTLLAHLPVHECVDDLCKKAAILWAGREMLGIVARRTPILGLSPGITHSHPVHKWKNRDCPHDAPQWWIDRLNVYRKLIRL
jgi:hypothetical protein